jgi:hypothetical protein
MRKGTYLWAVDMLYKFPNGVRVSRRAWKADGNPVWIMSLRSTPHLVRYIYGLLPSAWAPHPIDRAAQDWEIYE